MAQIARIGEPQPRSEAGERVARDRELLKMNYEGMMLLTKHANRRERIQGPEDFKPTFRVFRVFGGLTLIDSSSCPLVFIHG